MNKLVLPSEVEIQRQLARTHLLDFLEYVWWEPHPLAVGVHTEAIADRLSQAVEAWRHGESTFLLISLPFRHGKTDLVSRALPPYFLGCCADRDPDIILTGYGSQLVEGFSRKAKAIIGSQPYNELFPAVEVDRKRSAHSKWAVAGSSGEVTVAGLGGAITGSGGELIVVDDYCKSREEAESLTYRNKVWNAFKDDIMTRRAPAAIVVVVATRWHEDDLIGRILKEMESNSEFPHFESLVFPAESEEYESGYLFPERFDASWYTTQRATLGTYSAAALLDCSPQRRGGNMFRMDRVQVHESMEGWAEAREVRFWDLASTQKERVKDDPDWTVGARGTVTWDGAIPHLWIRDIRDCQEEAPRRNALILATADWDGDSVEVAVESVGGYKDAYSTLKEALKGRRTVTKVNVSGDKVVRSAPLEPVFEAGNVHILRADWNARFMEEFTAFPDGKHDDIVDAVSGVYHHFARARTVSFEPGAVAGVGVW